MENINEFKDNENRNLTISEMIRIGKLKNPGKYDHLPDPVSKPQNWSDEMCEKILKVIRKNETGDNI